MSYDRAITVFSPDGRLFQVEYAMEAVKRGAAAIGVVSSDLIVLAVEKKNIAALQDPRTIRKVCQIDEKITLTFAGLTADARILIDRARVECQSHRLSFDDEPSVQHVARFIAQTQQQFTQRGGRRPFGLSTLVAGFDKDGKPRLFQTDPSGTFSEWKACAIGRNSRPLTSLLERLYFNEEPQPEGEGGESKSNVASEELIAEAEARANAIDIAISALLEVVENGSKNIEVVLIRRDKPFELMKSADVAATVERLQREKEELVRTGRAGEPLILDSEY